MVDISKVDLSKLPKTVEGTLERLKGDAIKIPIAQIVPIIYVPLGYLANALVPSEEFTSEKLKGRSRIYVEAGSQHSMLCLLNITKGPMGINPPRQSNLNAHYDRDPETRKITDIYIPKSYNNTLLHRVAFRGSLDDLMAHPNVEKRD